MACLGLLMVIPAIAAIALAINFIPATIFYFVWNSVVIKYASVRPFEYWDAFWITLALSVLLSLIGGSRSRSN